jgi:hypothetical protein
MMRWVVTERIGGVVWLKVLANLIKSNRDFFLPNSVWSLLDFNIGFNGKFSQIINFLLLILKMEWLKHRHPNRMQWTNSILSDSDLIDAANVVLYILDFILKNHFFSKIIERNLTKMCFWSDWLLSGIMTNIVCSAWIRILMFKMDNIPKKWIRLEY